jgi:hypothetical protein
MTTEISSSEVFVELSKDVLIPQQQQNANESSTASHHETSDWVTVAILSALLAFLFSWLLMTIVYKLVERCIRGRQSFHQSGEHHVRKELEERNLRRYETIEHWLITKRVQKHDEFCTHVVCGSIQQGSSDKGVKAGAAAADYNCACRPAKVLVTPELQVPQHTTFNRSDDDSLFDEQDDDKECPICMNTLREGDIVSWSTIAKCSHFYHHECIKEWLLRKTECPCCRETFLPCDEILVDKTTKELKEMSKCYASRSATTFYCLHEGLISLPPMPVSSYTPKEKEELEKRIFDSMVKPEELVSLRGERQDTTTATIAKDDVGCGLQIEDPSECAEDEIVFEYSPGDTYTRITIRHGTDDDDDDDNSIEDPSENPCIDGEDILVGYSSSLTEHSSTIQYGTDDDDDNSFGDVSKDTGEEEDNMSGNDSDPKEEATDEEKTSAVSENV